MSEYWKSTPKYWCKHCRTYVKDTPFEKKQHETTGQHQSNLKRSLRGIQNNHERDEREKQKAKAEIDRLNRVVDGPTSTSASPASHRPPSVAQATQASTADRKRQITQLAEMGIEVPDELRGDMAMTGRWQVVSQRTVEEQLSEERLSIGVRKRKHEGHEEEEEAGETVAKRGWGSTTKRYPEESKPNLDALLSSNTVKTTEGTSPKREPPDDAHMQKVNEDAPETRENRSLKTEETEEAAGGLLKDIPNDELVPIFKKRKPKGHGHMIPVAPDPQQLGV